MKRLLLAAILAFAGATLQAEAKRPLNHEDFDDWQRVEANAISRSGAWSAYSVIPQEGDATLTLRNNRTGREVILPRGYRPAFSADEKWGVALIKPFYADTRKARIDKKKDYEMPRDTLALIDLSNGRVEKIPEVLGYKIGKKGGTFVAYQSCDTLHIKPSSLKDKEAGKPLVVRSLTSPALKIINWVKDYEFSKDGRRLALRLKPPKEDTLATTGVALVDLPDTSLILFDRDKPHYTLPVFSDDASEVAYTASTDTIESGTRDYRLYSLPSEEIIAGNAPREIEVSFPPLRINQHSRPEFSRDGRRLIIGIAPVIAPDDTTIVDFESPEIDIWRWDAPLTPPQEKANLNKLKELTLPVAIDLRNGFSRQLPTENLFANVEPGFGWNSDWVLVRDPEENIISRQWNYMAPEKLTAVNITDGRRLEIGEAPEDFSSLSPDGRFVVYFKDRHFHAFDTRSGKCVNISGSVPWPLWEEEDDHPLPPQPYGIAGWGEKDGRILVYDRHDIWSLDLTGASEPLNLTSGLGRKKDLQLRYHRFDKEKGGIDKGDRMILDVFDFRTKKRGLASITYSPKPVEPEIMTLDKYRLSQLTKAEDADVFVWQKANFSTVPDLWTCNGAKFSKAVRITSSNPQFNEISWGTAELVEWYAYDGKKAQGVLYLPEDFNPSEGSWPMLSVFYETQTENLYTHYTMEPSWSWVNYPFYVSRGYVIFVPDIHYSTGLPGESAYNYVCSGVEEMLKRYPSIDPSRVGIDGQSWGGYQTAYLITRTDMFACAGSGAPVANMTSAFGGIRWGSGDSRQAQYEVGQSRIGRNLWDAPELYLANSPLFKADRVKTPLLIMHNDADGAVPWYQGIEFFMALRRLGKPVWMLQYNGEAHNIKERRNRKDITKRLQQFFDHYLKGAPMPRWMREGISPLRKGQDFGY